MRKTILITGSTDGIGKLAAIKLAKDGHEIYLHGRNSDKLETVLSEIKEESNNENIKGFVADFSDLGAIEKMAIQVNNELSKLDVLINNAGVYKSAVSRTVDDLDTRFAVNYFAPFLLTKRLLSLLKKGNDTRVINLSSAAQAPVSMEALMGKEQISTQAAYAQSKLALTMWSFQLAKTEPELTVIAVNPGSLLNTRMVREGFGFHQSSPDKGANILCDLSILEEYKNASGKYFDNDIGSFGKIHPAGHNKEAIETLIEQTDNLIDKL
ncbi:MAG: SDR family NAD(P)-dependent oxidoreductase [Bacteroidota bacterium]